MITPPNSMNAIKEVLDRPTLLSILMLSVLVSILTLSIPIAAQTLVNVIAFGKLFQPVVTLSIMVLVLMVALGALAVWQSIIIEVVQQKIMVKTGLNLTRQFTRMSLESFSLHHGPELVNRFFEIVTINKALASLLLYGVNLSLQLFFGLILLLLYHPLFLLFDLFIIVSVLLVLFLPYRKGLEAAEQECAEKHQIGAWLEEVFANRFLFRFNRYDYFAIGQSDKRLVDFLKARNRHFRQLIKHQIGFYTLSAVASALLLGLGGYLVIHNQLSLGQLVAAEIVLGAMIYGFKRFGALLENYYDLMASKHKMDKVFEFPLETMHEEASELLFPIRQMTLTLPDGASATAAAKAPLLIVLNDNQPPSLLSNALFGLTSHDVIEMAINGVQCNIHHRALLRVRSILLKHNEWFAGTVYDNLRLNGQPFSVETLKGLLSEMGLLAKIMQLPKGLKTVIYDWDETFSALELVQMMMIRALMAKPDLLVIDGLLDGLETAHIEVLATYLQALEETLVVILTREQLPGIPFNRLVIS